jgi:hypothetical protein
MQTSREEAAGEAQLDDLDRKFLIVCEVLATERLELACQCRAGPPELLGSQLWADVVGWL